MKISAEEIRTKVRNNLNNRKLILWGSGDKAKEFYLAYKERLNIVGIMKDSYSEENTANWQDELSIIGWEEYDENEDYLIICDSPFAHVENQIIGFGFLIWDDYLDANLIDVMFEERKIAIVAGNCQIATICDFLKEIKGFTKEYHILRFSTHCWKSRWSIKSISYLKNLCDLYICMKHEEGDKKFFSKEELPDKCKIVTLPSALSRMYWPQIKMNREKAQNEYFLFPKKSSGHAPFEYGDNNINLMIREGKSVEEIISLLTSDTFYEPIQIENHFDREMRVLEYEEDGCDIKISDFVKENYRKQMLYRDMVHMQVSLICEMIKRILQHLDMSTDEAEVLEKDTENPVWQEYNTHCTEVPVYPCVAKKLGLQWWNEDIVYDVTFYNGIKQLTFEEYIRSYYEICSKMKWLMEEW